MARISIGDRARDRITGFEGIVVARTQWLGNCDRLTLQPPAADGKYVESATCDEPHVEFVDHTEHTIDKPVTTGGPRPAPVRTGAR